MAAASAGELNMFRLAKSGCPVHRMRSIALPACWVLALFLGLPGFCPDARGQTLKPYEFSLVRMGTLFRFELYTQDAGEASKAADAAFERVEELEESMSDYREDSELNRLARGGASGPRAVSPELFSVLAKSQEISRLSGGAFDITVGPVVQLWREAKRTGKLPSPLELARAKAAVDYRNIELRPEDRTVFLKRSDMKLDLGAIAKGYAADEALKVLKAHGIHSAMVVGGGEVALGAPPPGRAGWRVAIDSPDAEAGQPACSLVLHDINLSTSGDSKQYVEINGQRYSHVINPATGMGLQGASSTTVIAHDGATADALATALSVLPVADGIQLAESMEGVAAYMVRQAHGVWMHFSSRGFPAACSDSRK